jgi:hypothetical protein
MTYQQSQASPSQSQMSLRDYAIKRAKILVGCFRKSDANDPEIYAAAVVAVLVRWPVDVITSVTEPATGLPSKCQWLPSIAEITEACQVSYEPTKARLERERTMKALTASAPRRPTQDELDEQFQRLGLSHLRPGSKFNAGKPRHSDDERQRAQAVLDRYAAEAQAHKEAAE